MNCKLFPQWVLAICNINLYVEWDEKLMIDCIKHEQHIVARWDMELKIAILHTHIVTNFPFDWCWEMSEAFGKPSNSSRKLISIFSSSQWVFVAFCNWLTLPFYSLTFQPNFHSFYISEGKTSINHETEMESILSSLMVMALKWTSEKCHLSHSNVLDVVYCRFKPFCVCIWLYLQSHFHFNPQKK
jgi:hypothetical protein